MPEPDRAGPPGGCRPRSSRWMLTLVVMMVGMLAGCAAAIDPQAIADAQTAARVKTALINDPELGAMPIEVRVAQGIAHLTGRVPTQEEASRAIALARRVAGVQDVESQLQIGGETAVDPAPPPPLPPSAGRDLDQELRDLQAPPTLLALGASVSRTYPRDDALRPRLAVGPMIKLGGGRGVGPAIGFNWFHTDVALAAEGGEGVSRIYLKPFMAGVAYTVGPEHVSITTALVAGIAFNSLKVRNPTGGPLAVDVGNSFVWRPNVTVWRNLTRRTVLQVSAGYISTRLRVTFLDGDAVHVRHVNGNTVAISSGVAYRLF